MSGRRIPDKNTDRAGYQRYWRDRLFMEKLEKITLGDLDAICKDTPDPVRQAKYAEAYQALYLAAKHFREGWQL